MLDLVLVLAPLARWPCGDTTDSIFITVSLVRTRAVKHSWRLLAAALGYFILCTLLCNAENPQSDVVFPRFRTQELATDLAIGYAVLLVDLNGDGKKDIVVVDKTRVVWHENPTWKRRTIIQGQTKPDNVCIAASDIDGDG
jgi:hypothetical protein